jgi:hypothetical protein
MTALIPQITLAGLQAAWNATHTGISAEITHVGLGSGGYTPSTNQTALQDEKHRLNIAGGELAGPTQIHLTALDNSELEFWVREVGFYLADGTLFAVWSSAEGPLAYKSPTLPLVVAFDLDLSALPADSITVSTTGTLNLFMADELTRLSTAQIDGMTRDTNHLLRLRTLEQKVDAITHTIAGLRDVLKV